ncbi:MAG: hypothetical protein U0R19_25730 [Bryobacteraceae bacterium]
MRFSLCAAVLLFVNLLGAEWQVRTLRIPPQTKGVAATANHLYTWGNGLQHNGKPLRSESFGPAGCLADINDDRHPDLVLHRLPGELIWLEGPRFQTAHIIDTEADFANCLAATLHGRKGILLTHRGLQVRFYSIPEPAKITQKWPYHEIYSFYTASYQAGLLLQDINADGLPDILCGNYWIQSPAEFELPWRLYAINTYNDTPEAAHMRLQWINGRLLASQGELELGRVVLFTPPADPTQLWHPEPIAGNLAHPHAAARKGYILLAEATRLWLLHNQQKRLLHQGLAIHTLLETSDGFLAIGEQGALRLKQLP